MVDGKKLNINDAIEILLDFKNEVLLELDWYNSIQKHIMAELLYGSVSKGTNRPDSDIDMLIILPLEIEEKFTTGEYFYKYNGYTINIVIRSIEGLRKIAKENNDYFQKQVFENAVIISQNKNEAAELINKIVNIKE